MSSLLAEQLGAQRPRVLALPRRRARRSGAAEAIELAEIGGVTLDPWQQFDLECAMAEASRGGGWAAPEVGLIASRQNGKNVIIEARELYGAMLRGEWIIHTSHHFQTTRESFGRLRAMVEAHADLEKRVTQQFASATTGYSIRFRGGGRVVFIARSRASGRGRTADLLIFDEAQILTDEAQAALLPTISARPGAQAWYLGSAPDHDSTVFQRVRARGRRGGAGLIYMEHSADPEASLDDRAAWAEANPALGLRITEEAIAAERASMADDTFARERLSISPELEDGSGVFLGGSWREVCDPGAEAERASSIFALGVHRERSAAGVVAVGPGPVVEVIDYRPGVAWLVERSRDLAERYGAPFVVERNGPAGAFIEELGRQGVEVLEVDATAMTRATGAFYDRVNAGALAVRQNPDMDRAVAGATRREHGGTWDWDYRASTDDISLLVAATAGLWAYENREPEGEPWAMWA